jgi:23S rRNA pseudouridine1911/1915/1917 synthase
LRSSDFRIERLFDQPWPDPVLQRPFRPFAEPWLAGPVPPHWQNETVTTLAARLMRVSDAEAAALVDFGSVWLDDRPCLDPGHPLSGHGRFRLNPPAYGPRRFYESDPARIVLEDEDVLIYHKESGRPSQAVPHDAYNNVLAGLRRLVTARGDRDNRLWLLHRLDADTSGLLMLAKNQKAAGFLGKAFQNGLVAKEYLALGLGLPPREREFSVKAPIAKEGRRYVVRPRGPGLDSWTDFTVLDWADPAPPQTPGLRRFLFLARPRTGRTHQIRLHLAWAGWPLSGDRFYGRPEESPSAPRLMLVSAGLTFPHPRDQRETSLSLF